MAYSTVTEWWGSVVFSRNLPTTKVYFTFDLDVVASHLHGSTTRNTNSSFMKPLVVFVQNTGHFQKSPIC